MGVSKQTAFVLMLLLAFSVIVPGSAGYLSVKMEAIGQAHRDLISLENRLHRERLAARIKRVERIQRHRRTQPAAPVDREPCTSARGSGSGRDGPGTAGRRPSTSAVVPAQAGPGASRSRDDRIGRRWFHSRWQDAWRRDEQRRQAGDRWSRWRTRDLQEHDLAARPLPAAGTTGTAGHGEPGGTYGTDGITGMGGETAVWGPYGARPERRGRADVPGGGPVGDRETGRPSGLETGGDDGRENDEDDGRENDGRTVWEDGGETLWEGRGETRGRMWRQPEFSASEPSAPELPAPSSPAQGAARGPAPGPAVAGGESLPGRRGDPPTAGPPPGLSQSGSRPN